MKSTLIYLNVYLILLAAVEMYWSVEDAHVAVFVLSTHSGQKSTDKGKVCNQACKQPLHSCNHLDSKRTSAVVERRMITRGQ
jgi:hypothetical protein